MSTLGQLEKEIEQLFHDRAKIEEEITSLEASSDKRKAQKLTTLRGKLKEVNAKQKRKYKARGSGTRRRKPKN